MLRPRTGRILLLISGFLGLAAAGGMDHAQAVVSRYPRVLQYICRDGGFSTAQIDTLARYDALILRGDPVIVAKLRARNPRIELYNNWMPQNIVSWNENESFWYPDTAWSLIRLSQFYALKNDWFLRDIRGQRITEWDGYSANWTRYCPRGTYGSSKGLNYVEWLAQVAMPRIIAGGHPWARWGHGSSSFDGLMLEVMVDCLGSYGWEHYQYADPDQDGEAEGVYADCTLGGNADSLSVLYREMNEVFYQGIKPFLDAGLPILINGGAKYWSPWWQEKLTGVKLESWMYSNHPWWDWRRWFYGLNGWDQSDIWGPGYRWAEDAVGHTGVDSLEGWDRSILQVQPHWSASASTVQRMRRWGFGTALLGDGFYNYTRDECSVFWEPEYAWDFGRPLGDYFRESFAVQSPADTLFVRLFTKGFVEVNPNPFPVNGVPTEDSRFGFWQTVANPAAGALGSDRIYVSFSYPPAGVSTVEGCELRYADFPITTENWGQATPYAGNPILSPEGGQVLVTIAGLQPGHIYFAAVKNHVLGRPEPGISPVVSAQTLAGPVDQTPPAPIADLAVSSASQEWADLQWTAPGDDGIIGRAAAYVVRVLPERAILAQDDWGNALAVPEPPAPSTAGSSETLRVSGLHPGVLYGFAVRALDEAGNLGALSNRAAATTRNPLPPPRDMTPPTLVRDLRAVLLRPRSATLQWTAVGDEGNASPVARYVLALRADSAITTPSQWARADTTTPMPAPLEAGRVMLVDLDPLLPATTYGVALRAYDAAGNGSLFSPPLTFTTEPLPDTLPPAPIAGLHLSGTGESWLDLAWSAPADSGVTPPATDEAAAYILAWRPGPPIINDADWQASAQVTAGLPVPAPPGRPQAYRLEGLTPGASYAVALRSLDQAGNESPLSPPFQARTAAPPDLSPPAPPGQPSIEWIAGFDRVRLHWTPSADPRVVGYLVLAQGASPAWSRVDGQPVSETSYELDRPDPEVRARLAVVAVTQQGVESPRSPSVELLRDQWLVEGPFPHPVQDRCLIRVTVPPGGGGEDLTLEIRALTGELVVRLQDGPVSAGRALEYVWDRRTSRGERAGPGYYYLVARSGGQRTLRTIYLAP